VGDLALGLTRKDSRLPELSARTAGGLTFEASRSSMLLELDLEGLLVHACISGAKGEGQVRVCVCWDRHVRPWVVVGCVVGGRKPGGQTHVVSVLT
jgi:hypothetical protein